MSCIRKMKMKEKNKIASEFLGNSFYRLIFIFLTNIGGALFTIFTARILAPERFGIYTLALSVALMLIAIAEAGFSETLIRFVSLNANNNKKAKSYFVYLLKIKITILLVLSILLVLFSKLIANFYNNSNLFYPILISALYLFFYSLMQFISDLFYAFKNLKAYCLKEFIFQISRIALIFLFAYLAFISSSMPIIATVISILITIIFVLIYLKKRYKEFFKSEIQEINRKELFHYLKYLTISSFSILLLFYTDVLILGKFVSPEYIGFYKTASSIAAFAFSILVFTTIIYPILTTASKNKTKNISNILLYYISIFAFPITALLVILSKYFIRLLFGYEYLDAYFPLIVLSFLVIITPISEYFRVLLNSKGYTKNTAKIITIGSILNVILNLIFIYFFFKFWGPKMAVLGAAISTVLSRLYIAIVLISNSKKKFSIYLRRTNVVKPFIASLFMAFFMFYFTKLIYGRANIWLVSLDLILGIGAYVIVLLAIKGISKKEFRYLKEAILQARKSI